jgi:hypothetical protein
VNNSSPYVVTIPNPCHENWELMTPQEQGRHCKVCNKVIIDFTTMTNEEIILYLQSAKESVCGRIEEIDSQSLQPYIPLSKQAKLFLYALAIAFFTQVPLNVVGQKVKDSTHIAQMQYGQLTGKVTDEKGNPLDFATVRVLQNGIVKGGAKTDQDGYYMISNLKPGKYMISGIFSGYSPVEIKNISVMASQTEPFDLKLERKKSLNPGTIIKVGSIKIIDPANPGRKELNKNDIRHMGG